MSKIKSRAYLSATYGDSPPTAMSAIIGVIFTLLQIIFRSNND